MSLSMKIVLTPNFIKSSKKLSKKYRLIFEDLKELKRQLLQDENGAINLGGNCYKIRLKNSSTSVGKSGGFRIIYYKKIESKIYLLEIYTKTDIISIQEKKIIEILKDNNLL